MPENNTYIEKNTRSVLAFLTIFFAIVAGTLIYEIFNSYDDPFIREYRTTVEWVTEIISVGLFVPGFIYFIKKKKIGWLLLNSFMSFVMVEIVFVTVFVGAFFGEIKPVAFVLIGIFLLAYVLLLLPKVRRVFSVDIGSTLLTSILPAIASFFLMYETY